MTTDLLAAEICLRDAWPAEERNDCHGWQLRATAGGYNRANSVWPMTFSGDLTAAIDEAEAFYAARGLRARFQVFETSEPTGLDAVLAERGYAGETPCSTLAKPVTEAAAPAEVDFTGEASSSWLGVYLPQQPPEKAAELPRILESIPLDRAFIVARDARAPVAVALAVNIAGDVAIDCVAADPQARRKGAATRAMQTAEAWAKSRGARRLVLNVIDENEAAVALYAKLGYTRLSGYRYRVR